MLERLQDFLTNNGQITPGGEAWLSELESKVDQDVPLKVVIKDLDTLIEDINDQMWRANQHREASKFKALRLIKQQLENVSVRVYSLEMKIVTTIYVTLAVLAITSIVKEQATGYDVIGTIVFQGILMLAYFELLANSKEKSTTMNMARLRIKSDLKQIKQELKRAFTE